jgi:hypothetical protein
MTRRGTLAYYLAAWVIGSFIIALTFLFAAGPIAASALLIDYFFTLIAGLIGLLIFAFLLRLAAGLLKTHNLWIWTLLGAGIFVALIFLAALVSQKQPSAWQSGTLGTISTMIFRGAEAVRRSGLWQAPIDGAATAAILCLVDRAFAKVHDTPETAAETKRSPA